MAIALEFSADRTRIRRGQIKKIYHLQHGTYRKNRASLVRYAQRLHTLHPTPNTTPLEMLTSVAQPKKL